MYENNAKRTVKRIAGFVVVLKKAPANKLSTIQLVSERWPVKNERLFSFGRPNMPLIVYTGKLIVSQTRTNFGDRALCVQERESGTVCRRSDGRACHSADSDNC